MKPADNTAAVKVTALNTLPAPAAAAPALPLPDVAKKDSIAVAAKPATAPAAPAKTDDATKPTPALPAPAAGDGKLANTLSYAKDKTDLSDDAKSDLSSVADKVKQSQGSVRVVAYAGGTAEEASVAKRTSLARALQIRAYLISKGVNQMSISVQALGNNVPSGDAERADVYLK